jgi:hypothetical protein
MWLLQVLGSVTSDLSSSTVSHSSPAGKASLEYFIQESGSLVLEKSTVVSPTIICYHQKKKKNGKARCQWLTPVILATQEVEIRRIAVQSQHGKIVCELYLKRTLHTKRAGGVAQGVVPKFKPQYSKKKKNLFGSQF